MSASSRSRMRPRFSRALRCASRRRTSIGSRTRPFVSAFQHRYVWHVPGALNIDAMRHGAQALLGRTTSPRFSRPAATCTRRSAPSCRSRWGEPVNSSRLRDRRSADQGTASCSHMVRLTIADPLVRCRSSARWHVETGPAGHPRDRQRLPAAHGPHDRRHARRRWAGPLAGESGQRDSRRARSLAAGRAAPASGLFLVRVGYGR